VKLRERLAIRHLGEMRYGADLGQEYELQRLADRHGEDAGLAEIRCPDQRLDVAILDDLLAAGVTVDRFRWLLRG
jgi:hypothetical protein